MTASNRGWRRWVAVFGPLRLMLMLGAVVLVLLRPLPGTPPAYSGWEMVPTLIAPALVPLVFMVLLLDAIMASVQLASRPEARARYRAVIGVDLALAFWLGLWWWGYFRAIIPAS